MCSWGDNTGSKKLTLHQQDDITHDQNPGAQFLLSRRTAAQGSVSSTSPEHPSRAKEVKWKQKIGWDAGGLPRLIPLLQTRQNTQACHTVGWQLEWDHHISLVSAQLNASHTVGVPKPHATHWPGLTGGAGVGCQWSPAHATWDTPGQCYVQLGFPAVLACG